MFERYRVVHFVGIGGIGMSGIAEVLYNLGYEVTGSDLKESENTIRLRKLGVKIYLGHKPENIDSAHVVVVSSAVRSDNPEILEAGSKLIPVIPRAEMLAEIGHLKYSILVAGAHGKTSTTSLISAILSHAELDPTVVIGGRLKATGANARLGQGEFFVAEADESDGSFLKLSPTIAVVTNIDREHMDYFQSIKALCNAFREFLDKVPFYGLSILCLENSYLKELMGKLKRRYITYGFSPDADLRAYRVESDGLGMKFNVSNGEDELGEFRIPLIGNHNVLNALSAISVALELRVDIEKIKDALFNFSGIQRRFEFKGEIEGAMVYDDYGHHPVEIRATIQAIRQLMDRSQNSDSLFGIRTQRSIRGRFFVVFQPHRYTRTKYFFQEFLNSFEGTDFLYLMDIYPAGEKPIEGVSSEMLYKGLKRTGRNVRYLKDRCEIATDIKKELNPGDLILTLGAGDVWKLGEEILKY